MFQKILKIILVLSTLTAFAYVFYTIPKERWFLLYNKYFPCQRPITYSLGFFDPRFNISEKNFLQTIKDAEIIWEKSIGKNLFEYQIDSEDNLKVNLIYDYRQEATVKLRNLGLVVSDTRSSYNALKVKYETLQKSYLQEKIEYQTQIALFQNRQNEYNQKVESWNSKGGAPKNIYNELSKETNLLKIELAAINKMEDNINRNVADINALVVVINRLAQTLNLNASELNAIGKSRGEEFTEGEYKINENGEEINIYEFSTKKKLSRVLIHELGHALGLDHVADPKAVMYRLNQGTSDVLTNDDLSALKAYCRIK